MRKKIIKIFVLLMAAHAQDVLCQTTDLARVIHKEIKHYSYADPEGKDWEDTKKALAGHTQEEISNALLAELDVDLGNRTANEIRNNGVAKLYKAPDLPPALVCKELEKESSPKRKARMMILFYRRNTPEVTAELVRQLKDRRPAIEAVENYEMPVYSMRVCDVACNILGFNSDPDRNHDKITPGVPYERRDEKIKEMLKDLKLDNQQ